MSTNSIHSQMQTWLNKHGENTHTYSNALTKIEGQIDEIQQLLQGQATSENQQEISQKTNQVEIDYMEAELNYLKREMEIGKTFDFMEGEYDISDGETFIPAYNEQTGKLAQGDMDAWETDGEEGISMEEYRASQLGDAEGLSDEEYGAASNYADATFNNIDIDGDGILEKNELQGFYAAVDNADGSVDGKISSDSLGIDYTSDNFRSNIESFQQYLE